MDENVIVEEIPASLEEAEPEDAETCCLVRVGKNSEWLRLFEDTEVSIGRGVNVTYQLVSSSCPLMISRLHCIFKQKINGPWTVTDKKSLNGVWVNGKRLPAEEPYLLNLGDSIQLGVAVTGSRAEYDYVFDKQPVKDIRPYLQMRGHKSSLTIVPQMKRKLDADEAEPSTSSKLSRTSKLEQPSALPCSNTEGQKPGPQQSEVTELNLHIREPDLLQEASRLDSDLDKLQRYSQNIQMLWERVDITQRQVSSLEGEPQQDHSLRGGPVQELQKQLEMLKAKMHKMEALEKSFSETEKQLQVQKTQQQEELLKKQLEEALNEQKKVMAELVVSRKGFEEVLLAKDMELEVTKEEEKKARAQKEEVVTQMTEVLENELQCIICSEFFIEAVTLNCAHSFCRYCIGDWRQRKNECPICRQAILSQTRSLVLDNCIDRMLENLSLEMKERRQALITERKGAKTKEVIIIHGSSSDSGGGS